MLGCGRPTRVLPLDDYMAPYHPYILKYYRSHLTGELPTASHFLSARHRTVGVALCCFCFSLEDIWPPWYHHHLLPPEAAACRLQAPSCCAAGGPCSPRRCPFLPPPHSADAHRARAGPDATAVRGCAGPGTRQRRLRGKRDYGGGRPARRSTNTTPPPPGGESSPARHPPPPPPCSAVLLFSFC